MTVTQLVPIRRDTDVPAMLAALRGGGRPAPFSAGAVACLAALSQALFRDPDARRFPALQALAFWLRRAELDRLARDFTALATPDTLRVPHGLALHFPPGNVDTMFVYSWALATLTGNRSIVRLSGRASEVAFILQRLLNAVAADQPDGPLATGTAMVTYPHDPAITAALSAACDLRILWGGDATVTALRAVPLPPHARELAFPDRYSVSVLNPAAVTAADDAALAALADGLFNDLYWFDQMGCSSPRMLLWVGHRPAARAAADRLTAALAATVARRGYALDTGAFLQKLTFAYGAAATRPVERVDAPRNELTLLELAGLEPFSHAHPGAGLLFHAAVAGLDDLTPVLDRRFQTVTYFGIEPAVIRDWLRRVNGRGVDRAVPVGQALQFHRFWDGYDLLEALTRAVHVPDPGAGSGAPEAA